VVYYYGMYRRVLGDMLSLAYMPDLPDDFEAERVLLYLRSPAGILLALLSYIERRDSRLP
jgi:hypothetical protein